MNCKKRSHNPVKSYLFVRCLISYGIDNRITNRTQWVYKFPWKISTDFFKPHEMVSNIKSCIIKSFFHLLVASGNNSIPDSCKLIWHHVRYRPWKSSYKLLLHICISSGRDSVCCVILDEAIESSVYGIYCISCCGIYVSDLSAKLLHVCAERTKQTIHSGSQLSGRQIGASHNRKLLCGAGFEFMLPFFVIFLKFVLKSCETVSHELDSMIADSVFLFFFFLSQLSINAGFHSFWFCIRYISQGTALCLQNSNLTVLISKLSVVIKILFLFRKSVLMLFYDFIQRRKLPLCCHFNSLSKLLKGRLSTL